MMEKLTERKTALELELQHSAANHNATVGAIQLVDHIKKEVAESVPEDIQVYLDELKVKLTEQSTQSITHHNTLVGKLQEVQDLLVECPVDDVAQSA